MSATDGREPFTYPLGFGQTLAAQDWVEWHFHKLLASRFVAHTISRGQEEAAFYGMLLWAESYRQDPAGTLPDDDVQLAQLARLGRDVDRWRELRPHALYGWAPIEIDNAEASDGPRLGHMVIAQIALKSWQRRDGKAQGREAARLANLRHRVKGQLQSLGKAAYAANPEAVQRIAAWLAENQLFVTGDNVSAGIAAVLIGGDVVPMSRRPKRG